MVKKQYYWHRLFGPASSKKKLLGDYPQVTLIKPEGSSTFFADWPPILDNKQKLYFKANKKTKLTDFLTSVQLPFGHTNLLFNEKVKSIMDGFKLSEHIIYNCEIELVNGDIHDYYLYYFPHQNLEYVDFEKSKFKFNFYLHKTTKYDAISLHDIKDASTLIDRNKLINPLDGCIIAEVLYLKEDKNDLDLIKLKRCPFYSLFINDRLKNALIEKKVNGWGLQSQECYSYYGIQKYTTL